MHRFIAFSWPIKSPRLAHKVAAQVRELRHAPQPWSVVLSCDGLVVLQMGDVVGQSQAMVLRHNQGVVLGTLFPNIVGEHEAFTPKRTELDGQSQQKVIDTHGRSLCRDYWGRYVAFIAKPGESRYWVIRDPMGTFPCYHYQHNDIDVFVSRESDLTLLPDITVDFNWSFLVEQFFTTEPAISDTGISRLTELLPGQCMEISEGKHSKEFYWQPIDIYNKGIIGSYDEAVKRTYSTTRSCVNAWASIYSNVSLKLSGGFDSAVVLSCLNNVSPRPDISCVNLFTSSSEGDERRYAQLAADKSHCDMNTVHMVALSNLAEAVGRAPLTLCPDGDIFSFSTMEPVAEFAKRQNAQAFFTGEGGDHIFGEGPSALYFSDFLQDQGLGSDFFNVAMEVAHVCGQSVWSVLYNSFQRRLLNKKGFIPFPNKTAVMDLFDESARSIQRKHYQLHPWMDALDQVPFAKCEQISRFPQILRRRKAETYTDVADLIHPLLSQPLVELSIRTPLYLTTSGARVRSVAKEAFATDIPSAILRRRSKGSTQPHFHNIVNNNLPFIRDYLLNGHFVDKGFIKTAKLEQFLSTRHIKDGEAIRAILRMTDTQAWIDGWQASQTVINQTKQAS